MTEIRNLLVPSEAGSEDHSIQEIRSGIEAIDRLLEKFLGHDGKPVPTMHHLAQAAGGAALNMRSEHCAFALTNGLVAILESAERLENSAATGGELAPVFTDHAVGMTSLFSFISAGMMLGKQLLEQTARKASQPSLNTCEAARGGVRCTLKPGHNTGVITNAEHATHVGFADGRVVKWA
jgi:hypothetical protein